MKRIAILLILLLLAGLGFAAKLGTLSRVLRPEMIRVVDDEIYVVEGTSIFAFRLKDLGYLRHFGQEGEGPGELKNNPSFTNFVTPLPGSLLVMGLDKAIRFSPAGNVLEEFRIPPFANFIYPVADGFIALRLKIGDKQQADLALVLLDKEMSEIKEICSQKLSGGQNLIDLTYDGMNLAIYKNRLYVEESRRGFVVSVFDLEGNLDYRIEKEFQKIPFTDADREEALAGLKRDPAVKSVGWENFEKFVRFIEGEYLPPIQDILVDSDKIHVITSRKKEGRPEMVVMDLQGKILKRLYLPRVQEGLLGNKLFGRPARFYDIHQDRFYYLQENEDDEQWEVHFHNL